MYSEYLPHVHADVYLIYVNTQTLISRNYRGDVDMSIIDKFLPMVLDAEEEGTVSPILVHEKVTFVYIKHNNLYRILDNIHVTAMEVVGEGEPFSSPNLHVRVYCMCLETCTHRPSMFRSGPVMASAWH